MFKWLVESGYRAPIAVPRIDVGAVGEAQLGVFADRTEAARVSIARRKLDAGSWVLIDAAIDAIDWMDPAVVTARTMLVWLRWTGARRSEFERARGDDVSGTIERGGVSYVFWRVVGKGDKVRRIPLNVPMIDAYRRYANTLGLDFAGDFGRLTGRPLFEMPRGGVATGAISLRAATGVDLYQAVQRVAEEAAKRSTDALQRERLRSVSPHWFRHRRAFELERRVSLSTAAQFLGHASVVTTQNYSSAEDVDLAEAVYGAGRSRE
jgi:integrase